MNGFLSAKIVKPFSVLQIYDEKEKICCFTFAFHYFTCLTVKKHPQIKLQ